MYKGALAAPGAYGCPEIIPRSKYFEVSPSIRYEIISPYFTSMEDERQHRQIADQAFQDKSRQALTRHLEEQQFSYRELDRVIKVDEKTIVEWEGVFALEDGKVWFLECKHYVSTAFYPIKIHLTVI